MSRTVFTHDLERCTGCGACRIACRLENQLGERSWRRVVTFNPARDQSLTVLHHSIACCHCADPPCLRSCPAGAYTRDLGTGAVMHKKERCIGCRYCTWVCPFGAPLFHPNTGTIEKCTFCLHRQDQGLAPACVTACPTEALGVAQVQHEEGGAAAVPPGFPEIGCGPAVQLINRRRGTAAPAMALPDTGPPRLTRPAPDLWSGLRNEWSLVLLTFTATCLVAWFSAATVQGKTVVLLPFLAAGALACGLSSLHLGRPWRAPLAIRNLRSSWISREVLLLTLFLGTAAVATMLGRSVPVLAWSAVGLGWAALVAIDLVYRVPGQEVAAIPHSAMTTLGATVLIALLLEQPWLLVIAGALQATLYLVRKLGHGSFDLLTAVRLLVGLVAPLVLWLTGIALDDPVLVVLVLAGTAVGRAELYGELRFLDPRLQADRDLEDLLAGGARSSPSNGGRLS